MSAPQAPDTPDFAANVDAAVERLQDEERHLFDAARGRLGLPKQRTTGRGASTRGSNVEERARVADIVRAFTPEERLAYDALTLRLDRLHELQEWMKSDPGLFQMVDLNIGNRVKGMSRRQATLSVVLSIISLLAGWLLSALAPASVLAHIFGR